MIWTSLFLLLVLSDSNYSYAYNNNECKVLTAICRQDPKCSNVELFSQLCVKKYQQYSSGPDNLSWLYPSAEQKQEQSYSTDDKASNYYPNDKYLSNNQDSNSRQDYQGQQNFNQVKQEKRDGKSQFKSVEEVLNIYNLYKRHSVQESLKAIRQKLDRDFINTSNNDNSDYIYNQNSNHYDVTSDSSTNELDIVRKAVALLKKVNNLNLPSKSKRLAKAVSRKIITAGESTTNSEQDDRKKKREDSTQTIETKEFGSPRDTEEVAIPIYSSLAEKEEGLIKKETASEDTKDDNKDLVIRLSNSVDKEKATKLGDTLQSSLTGATVSLQKIDKDQVSFHIISDKSSADSVAKKINEDTQFRKEIESESGEDIIKASTSEKDTVQVPLKPVDKSVFKAHITVFAAVVGACTLALIVAAVAICLVKRKQKSSSFPEFKKHEAVEDYKELCRTQMSVANARADDEEDETDKNNAMRHNWYEDQFPYNMDISTGHVILAYMEDHLKNENRLNKEWEALCNYKADDAETHVGCDARNAGRNRYRDVLPFDRTRVKLREVVNVYHSDYINANYITDVDPQNPDYIAAQGPLDKTVADFWQMVWEQGVVVVVNLTKLSDMGLPQCHRYWPEDGSEIYHIYEVHLISEHIWCDDYLVRSLYLKNLQTGETRTITQFHYLTWPDLSIPESARPLLEFRRKVNKCYRGQACPIVVHCNNGVGRTGTYILLDMVLNKMVKGAKEIDIAATLEHLRDQRQDMVKTKGQFEFALTAMAEEVTAILSAVPK